MIKEILIIKTWFCLFILSLFVGLSLLSSGRVSSAEFCVDKKNTTGTVDGTCFYPYKTIQAAINAASAIEDNTIRVAAGSYTENISIDAKVIDILGGYAGGTSGDYGGGTGGIFDIQSLDTNVTVIQGNGANCVVTLQDSGLSVLDGFSIKGGGGHTDPWTAKGGGVYAVGGSPTISRNIIEENDTRHSGLNDQGGGIYLEGSNGQIIGNTVKNNTASRGGGIAIDGEGIVIKGNTIQGNTAVGDHGGGGGIVIFGEESSATFSYNRFYGNYATTAGGGVFVDDGSTAELHHELIFNNTSVENGGGGIYVDGAWDNIGSTATLKNCTIVYNICTGCLSASGLYIEYYSSTTVMDTIFWGNGGDDFYADGTSQLIVTYSTSQETISGEGNQNLDPLFANPGSNDYHLKSQAGRWDPTAAGGAGGWIADVLNSPCIDMGNPLNNYTKEKMPNGGRINMGAYGNTSEASKGNGSKSILLPYILLLY